MEQLPITSDPVQSFAVVLGVAKYQFDIKFNDGSQSWTFDLSQVVDASTTTEILASVPILIGIDMLAPYALGIGGLVATDISGAYLDAGPDDLGSRVIVTYFSTDEVAQIKAAGGAL